MATIGGARAIGREDELGSLEPGKMGDVVVMDLGGPATRAAESTSVYSRIVYSASRDAVRWVVVDGEILVEAGRFEHLDEETLLARFEEEANALTGRAGIN
jgi:5-methylthioadenosine/S-adenosylhomocysteine deaminase